MPEIAVGIAEELMKNVGEGVKALAGSPDTLLVDKDVLLNVMRYLKDHLGFNYLTDLTAVDYQDHFTVVYRLKSLPGLKDLVVKVEIDRNNPVLPSVIGVWKAADWQEREAYDLMGIEFSGHPNLKRILLPEDFAGHPLRKDYKGGQER